VAATNRYTPPESQSHFADSNSASGSTGPTLALLDSQAVVGSGSGTLQGTSGAGVNGPLANGPSPSRASGAPVATPLHARFVPEVTRPDAMGPSGSAAAVAARANKAVQRLDSKVRGRVAAAVAGTGAGQVAPLDDNKEWAGAGVGGELEDGDSDLGEGSESGERSDWPSLQLASPAPGDRARFVVGGRGLYSLSPVPPFPPPSPHLASTRVFQSCNLHFALT
jgi:hypothetical protein